MSSRFKLVFVFLFTVAMAHVAFCQGEAVPWEEHYRVALPDGFDPWCGPVVGVSGSTEVVVATTHFPNGKPIEIYYPSETVIGEQVGGVLFVAGNSDVQIRAEEGRPWLHSNQVLGWGRLVAEHGLIGISYENDGHPDDSLKAIGEWVVEHGADYGIDSQDVGLWSASNGCAVAVDAFRGDFERFGGVTPRFGVFFYGNVPYRSDQHFSIPLFVAYAERDWLTDADGIGRFVERVQEQGGQVQLEVHTSGRHAFDVKGENEETSQIINAALSFMVGH